MPEQHRLFITSGVAELIAKSPLQSQGLYYSHTKFGRIVVNGVVATCYTSHFDEALGQRAAAARHPEVKDIVARVAKAIFAE